LFGSYCADKHTDKHQQMPLKTSISLRYAMPVGKNLFYIFGNMPLAT